MTFLLRRAERADYASIRPMLDIMGHASEPSLEERFTEYVESSSHCILVATSDRGAIGYAWAQNYGPHLRSGKSYARLHDLAVSQHHRRQGIGRALFNGVVKWCEEAGIVELQWQAARSAAPFYDSLGLRGDTKSDLVEHPFYEIVIKPSN